MIQRIQTIYLLLVTALLVVTMCFPLGFFSIASVEYPFNALGLEVNGTFQSTWGVLSILIMSAMVSLATVFLYKNRKLQIRMSIFNSLLLIGFYIAFAAFYFAFKNETNTFRIGCVLCLPLIAIILNLFAIRAIKHDEAMVKAADRIR